jgi:hypothetical protein
LLARLLRLDHDFWVVLGTLSVLRSNALATGRTTLEALAGTVAGFAVGALVTGVAGAPSVVLWVALPMVGDLINVIAEMGYRAEGCSAGVTALQAQMQVLLATFLRLADRLGGALRPTEPQERVSDAVLHAAALACLQRWRDDPAGGRAAIAVVVAGEWIAQLGVLAADLEEPLTVAVEAARVPWWR